MFVDCLGTLCKQLIAKCIEEVSPSAIFSTKQFLSHSNKGNGGDMSLENNLVEIMRGNLSATTSTGAGPGEVRTVMLTNNKVSDDNLGDLISIPLLTFHYYCLVVVLISFYPVHSLLIILLPGYIDCI